MNARDISILVPYKGDNGQRDRIWSWVRQRYEKLMPDAEICVGNYYEEPFSRAIAINKAASMASRNIFLIADSDIVFDFDDLMAAGRLLSEHSWVIPYTGCRRLTWQSTDTLLQQDSRIIMRNYSDETEAVTTHSVGGICLLYRRHFIRAGGFDTRFHDWGYEDNAFQMAMDSVCGPYKRSDNEIWHLWHPFPLVNMEQVIANENLYNTHYATTPSYKVVINASAGKPVKAVNYRRAVKINIS